MNNDMQKKFIILAGVLVVIAVIAIFVMLFRVPFALIKTSPENGGKNIALENFVFTAVFNKRLNVNKTKGTFKIEPPVKGDISIKDKELIFKATEQIDPIIHYVITFEAYDGFLEKPIKVKIEFDSTIFGFPKPPPPGTDFD